jgi:hypothetical protein
MGPTWRRNVALRCFALLVCASLLPPIALHANTLPRHCTLPQSSLPTVTIRSCRFHLADSDAGNLNYYVIVDLTYSPSQSIDAVRFAIDAGNGKRYQIDRQHVSAHGVATTTFRLISPRQTISHVSVWADEAS